MSKSRGLKIGEILSAEGFVTADHICQALETQKKDHRKLGELLIDKGWVEDQHLYEALAKTFHLPFVRLDENNLNEDVLSSISYDLMQSYKILPVSLQDNILTVATSDPLNVAALQEIQYTSGYTINPVMASLKEIDGILQKFSDSLGAIHALKGTDNQDGQQVVQLVDSIIGQAIREKASDIHFEPQRDKMRVRFRIDGELYERTVIPKNLERNVISRIKIMAGIDVAESRRPQDGRFALTKHEAEFDVRLSTLPDILGENLVLRILSKWFVGLSYEALGMDPDQSAVMSRLIRKPHGLILVTGPTGSGKTTTLYSALSELNQTTKNIISVEDPVEYELPGVTQTARNPYTGYTFANAIRHILRHDPDIIMVGEIRDVETADMAIRAALTGHLVLSTLHTNSAAGAITRLLEMGIEPFLISSSLQGIIAQRLVRRLCPSCKNMKKADEDVSRQIREKVSEAQVTETYVAGGCPQCLQTGYQGRLGIFEILEIDQMIRSCILRSGHEEDILLKAREQGMKTLQLSGIGLVSRGLTTIEEVSRIIF